MTITTCRPRKQIVAAWTLALLWIVPLHVAWAADARLSKGQTLYVPVYSHIYSGDRERPVYLAVTVSIRNTDPAHSIHLTAVDYYDSAGKQLRRFLEKPITLAPMASTRYVVKESDKSGGSGANFIVSWQSDIPINPPLTEGVMISTASQLGISFVTRGVPIVATQP
jgi:hypothetical protein